MSHLLAFSGLHVSLLLGLLGGLLRLFRLFGKLVLAIQLIALLSCLVFIGPFPSALRAGGMATLMIVGRWIGRPSSALHALGLTTTILLIWEPNLSQHLGFQLSCGATAGILSWSRPVSLLLCSCMPRTGHPKWQTVQRWLGQWLAPNLAVLPLTVPVLLWRFHEFNLLGLWINALFAPLFSLGFMVSLFVPLLGPMLGGPLRWCTEGLLELLDLPWWWDWWTAPCPMHGTTAAIVTFCLAWSADRLFSSREIDC